MRILAIAILVAVLGAMGVVAGEPEKKQAEEKKEPEKQEVVTNETLKKKYGEPEPATPPQPPMKGTPSPKAEEPTPAAQETDQAGRVVELKKEEERLNRRIQSLKNPFLPKVPLTDEEKKDEAGKGADVRVRMLEERLAKIRDELKRLGDPPVRTP